MQILKMNAVKDKNKSTLPPFNKGVLGEITNKAGVTLVEVMIALLILLLVFIGLLQAALLGIDHNMRNVLRDEATKIATMRMEQARSLPFTSLVSDTSSISGADCPSTFTVGNIVERNIRNVSNKDFCSTTICSEYGGDGDCTTDDADTKQIRVRVGWRWKGENYTHSITTLRRR